MMAESEHPWSKDSANARLQSVFTRLDVKSTDTKSVFTKDFRDRSAANLGTLGSQAETPLSGALVSVKALFDVEGEQTHAGAGALKDVPVAKQDAPCIARLRAAGAVFTGHTNMSEFAYSGLGLNPHYGTPDNPILPGHVPGGSSCGGAVSVALGLSDIAIGSDTGGSLRIPAAFTGIVGFKPTQASVSLQGARPLSDTLDSLGPMSRSVAACELAWQVMAGHLTHPVGSQKTRLVVDRGLAFTELDDVVAQGFEHLLAGLSSAGFEIVEKSLEAMEMYSDIPPWHLTSVESRAHYEEYFQTSKQLFDQRVYSRMARAEEISAVEYRQTLNSRARFAADFAAELGGDLLFLPTTPKLAPALGDVASDGDFNRHNLLALRNPSIGNVADGCGIALPYHYDGVQLSAMLLGGNGQDQHLLSCAKAVERQLPKL